MLPPSVRCLPLLAAADTGLVLILILVGLMLFACVRLVIAWFLSNALGSGDPNLIYTDLARRGATLLRLRGIGGEGRDERAYEVSYAGADGAERVGQCKVSQRQGVWWEGAVPPVLADGAPAAGEAEPVEAARGYASAPLAPEAAPEEGSVDPETAWDQEHPDREYDGVAPEAPPRSVPELLDVLRAGEPRACEQAVAELVRHGPAIRPQLEAALSEPDADVRVDIRKALHQLDAHGDSSACDEPAG